MKLPKTYDPQAYEPRIYELWETAKAFAPQGDTAKGRFGIALPPPNANGNLHIGHALTVAVEDIMVRYHRLRGVPTVFIPGADHAGFETWVVFEKHLEKEGRSRFDFSRDELYGMVWDFVEKQRGNMEIQLRELGASVDWDSFVFTLDKKVIDRTYKTFQQLWDKELVYRGKRIVNYCTKHQTSFADIEVDHEIEKSKLWTIAYPLADATGEILVATTRPETLLGDTAIAVHPDDARYKKLIGKHAVVPLTDRTIPIIADEAIDPSFGTGAVKVTPAHDPVDFDIGERHTLPAIQVVGFDGNMTDACPKQFVGLPVAEARSAVLTALEADKRIRKEEPYSHSVGHCYKCKTIIQPLLKDQWFLNVEPLAKKAIAAIEKGEIAFTPKSKGKVLVNYYKNLRDWNLSRQIAWGIPIPAFQSSEDPETWLFDTRVDQPTIEVDGVTYHRDEDTFDTWFSSGQWPFITTGYLDKGTLSPYYPLSVMETGHDILYFWIARMIMLGLTATGKVPFKHVYLHGLVNDEHGQKMSKSRGNVINPQDMVQQYGSDATRMGLIAGRSPGVDQAFTPGNIVAGRNFANKLWNIARYVEDKLGDAAIDRTPKPESLADHWILGQLNSAGKKIGKLIESYRFAEAFEVMYHTVWDDVADWYIESSKTNNNPSVLAYSLETCLTLAHPFAPFVTETIWQTLAWEKSLLATNRWPQDTAYTSAKAKQFAKIQALVSEARFVMAGIGQGKQPMVFTDDPLIAANQALITKLANLQSITKVGEGRGLRLAVVGTEAWLDIDADTLKKHQQTLQGRLHEAAAHIQRLESRLGNTRYVANAPATVVAQTREQLAQQQALSERLRRELDITHGSRD